jgi:hypothetical protein
MSKRDTQQKMILSFVAVVLLIAIIVTMMMIVQWLTQIPILTVMTTHARMTTTVTTTIITIGMTMHQATGLIWGSTILINWYVLLIR